jgi:hypothetical protein
MAVVFPLFTFNCSLSIVFIFVYIALLCLYVVFILKEREEKKVHPAILYVVAGLHSRISYFGARMPPGLISGWYLRAIFYFCFSQVS